MATLCPLRNTLGSRANIDYDLDLVAMHGPPNPSRPLFLSLHHQPPPNPVPDCLRFDCLLYLRHLVWIRFGNTLVGVRLTTLILGQPGRLSIIPT